MAPLVVIARSIGPASVRSAASLATSTGEVGPHRRLAAGEADRLDAVALDHQPGEALDLLEREHLAPRQPRHPLVGMQYVQRKLQRSVTEIAQVADDPPERVDEILACRITATPGSARRRTATSAPAAMPSPSGDHDERVGEGGGGELVAALGADRAHVERPSSPNRPMTRTKWTLPSGRRRRSASVTPTTLGRARRRWPIIRRSAGRASSSKLTSELTGLPGRPNTGTVVRAAVEQAEGERLGRLDGDLHPLHVGDPPEHRLDDVVVAHAHAAARDDGVALGRGVAQHAPPAPPRRRGRPRSIDDAPGLGEQRREHRQVALADLPRPQRRAVGHQLVAGGQHGRHAPPGCAVTVAALMLASTPATAGVDDGAGGEHHGRRRARRRRPGARRRPRVGTDAHPDACAAVEALGVLDHHDRVGAGAAPARRS